MLRLLEVELFYDDKLHIRINNISILPMFVQLLKLTVKKVQLKTNLDQERLNKHATRLY